jgi:hypothetical protein
VPDVKTLMSSSTYLQVRPPRDALISGVDDGDHDDRRPPGGRGMFNHRVQVIKASGGYVTDAEARAQALKELTEGGGSAVAVKRGSEPLC